MEVGARWLGEFVGEDQLKPGDLFMTKDGPLLALRIVPAVGHANILIMVNADPENPAPVPRALDYRMDPNAPERVRRLGGKFRLEPLSKDLRGLRGFDGSPRSGFAILRGGGLAVHYLEPTLRLTYELSTGKQVDAAGAILLQPQRLLWEQGDDVLELCCL
jgi:hypothetical protein